MIRFSLRRFQSYALLTPPKSMPTTHDLSFHDKLSVRVRSPLLLPRSYLPSVSYLLLIVSSNCITVALGYRANNLSSLTWKDSTSGSVSPFKGPVTASPFTCRHQLLVVTSSNIALK